MPLVLALTLICDFYPRPPRGGRRFGVRLMSVAFRYFYPRPPRGGRRHRHPGHRGRLPISIHALREEGDARPDVSLRSPGNFYPRPPRGGRPPSGYYRGWFPEFLSTPSARRATSGMRWHPAGGGISIHALREEGDVEVGSPGRGRGNFYPRPPRGGRPACVPCGG